MSAGSVIAADIAMALGEAGAALGDGPLRCVIKKADLQKLKPWHRVEDGFGDLFEVVAIQDTGRTRDRNGTLISETKRILTIEAGVVDIEKSDRIAVGETSEEITEDTVWLTIEQAEAIAPGGVPLLYQITLQD